MRLFCSRTRFTESFISNTDALSQDYIFWQVMNRSVAESLITYRFEDKNQSLEEDWEFTEELRSRACGSLFLFA